MRLEKKDMSTPNVNDGSLFVFSCHSGNFYDMNVNAMVNLYLGANEIQ
jgi:hypothetical protein